MSESVDTQTNAQTHGCQLESNPISSPCMPSAQEGSGELNMKRHILCGRKLQSFAIHFSWLGPELFRLLLVHRGSTDDLHLLQISSCVVWQTRDLHLSRNTLYLVSSRLCFFIVLKRDLIVYRDDSLTS